MTQHFLPPGWKALNDLLDKETQKPTNLQCTDTVTQQQRVLGMQTNIHGPLTSRATTSLSPEPGVGPADWSMMLAVG